MPVVVILPDEEVSTTIGVSYSISFGITARIVLDQLKNFLGLKAQGDSTAPFLKRFWLTMTEGGPVHWPTIALGAATVLLALGLRRLNRFCFSCRGICHQMITISR